MNITKSPFHYSAVKVAMEEIGLNSALFLFVRSILRVKMESESLNRKPIEKYIWISISLVIGIPSIAVLVYFAIEYPKGRESRVFTGFEEICGEQYDRMFKCADVPVYVYVEDRSSLNYPRWVDFLAKYVNSWLVIFAVISIIIFIVQARKLWWRNKYDYLIAAAVIMLLFSNCFVDWSDHLP